jgi:integrase
MAYYYPKGKGFLVRWREPGGKMRSKLVPDEESARELKARLESEARTRRVLRDVPGIPGWGDSSGPIPPAAEDEFAFAAWVRAMVERDHNLRPASLDKYLTTLRNHIEGTPLGAADVRTIEPEDIAEFWSGVRGGAGSRRNVWQVLGMAFTHAVRSGLIDVSPLARAGIKAPRKDRERDIDVLTVRDVERLADAATSRRDRAAVLLMAYGGLRAGEVGGLRVRDVDFSRCRFTIRQQVVRTRDGKDVGRPKSTAAQRTIQLAPSVCRELRALLDDVPPTPDGRIFHGPNGELWASSNIGYTVRATARRAGLRDFGPHTLRHTAVSLLVADGANPRAVQAFVGHSSVAFTLQVYASLFDFAGAELAASMERQREAYRNGS